jgi:hypothetical protein
MAIDLEQMRVDVEAYLEKMNWPVFHGYHRMVDALVQVNWDTNRHPDFREFVECAKKAGAKLIVFYYDSFSQDKIDEALDQLEVCDLTREEKRSYESRLRSLQAYEGFTSTLHLSFALDGRMFLFDLRADWYEALDDILMDLDVASADLEEEEGSDGPVGGGYFSNN